MSHCVFWMVVNVGMRWVKALPAHPGELSLMGNYSDDVCYQFDNLESCDPGKGSYNVLLLFEYHFNIAGHQLGCCSLT